MIDDDDYPSLGFPSSFIGRDFNEQLSKNTKLDQREIQTDETKAFQVHTIKSFSCQGEEFLSTLMSGVVEGWKSFQTSFPC